MFIPDFPVIPVFHHLPKVHKGLIPLTGRPIVAGIGSLNECLSHWVDQQLQPLVVELPGFVKDTTHLLSQLRDFVWREDYR